MGGVSDRQAVDHRLARHLRNDLFYELLSGDGKADAGGNRDHYLLQSDRDQPAVGFYAG